MTQQLANKTRRGRYGKPVAVVESICAATQPLGIGPSRLAKILEPAGVIEAVRDHNSERLYEWLLEELQYQGISDAAADGYLANHGTLRYAEISRAFQSPTECRKLLSFDSYTSCGFRKISNTCAEPILLPACPVGKHDLRNGRLNQIAYSLYLFIRDVCGGDLVSYIDYVLERADRPDHPDRLLIMRDVLLADLKRIHGISDKVLSMSFANLLQGADPHRPRWVATGATMIAVDRLVHNFLVRTGIVRRVGAPHPYGPGCYRETGCAAIIDRLARQIDARKYDLAAPTYCPRLIQFALWIYCSQAGLNICNGNKIDAAARCKNRNCTVYALCERNPLRPGTDPMFVREPMAMKGRGPPPQKSI